MAFTHHLHKSLIAAKATSAAASSTSSRLILSRRSVICASRLQPTMLQNGMLRNNNSLNLQSSSLFLSDKIEKCMHMGCRKLRVSCPTKGSQLRVLRLFSTERSLIRSIDGSTWSLTTQSLRKLEVRNKLMPSIFVGRSDINISSNTTFSHVPRAIINNKGSSPGDEPNIVKSSALNMLNKHSKKTKAVAVQKDAGVVDSGKQLVEDGIADVSSGPSASTSTVSTDKKVPKAATGKQKQPSRSKKSKVPASGANAVSDKAAQRNGSEIVAPVKNRSSTKKTKPSLALAPENSSGTTTVEAPGTSSSIGQLPKSKTAKPTKKGKAAKEVVPLVNGHVEPQVSSNCELSKLSGKGKLQEQKTLPSLFPPTGRSVVIVESATKAKVIQRYLGDMFEVIPSNGHVRDLAARSGSVRPDDDFRMVWEVPSAAWPHLNGIKVALTGADRLILASDPDREGEAIAWHILEMLQQQDALREDILVARVVFIEITESSIKNALRAPRHIDENLVHAYLARRALDYLIGFNISPVLWRKLPGCQSAGRVQSAALSLISDREMEIDRFKPQEYWTVDVKFKNGEGVPESSPLSISSHLTQLDSTKLNQLSISSETEAKTIEKNIRLSTFTVVGSKRSTTRRNPPTPYITSTLQQDAANKLHFSAHYTMKLAQKLYEGVQMSDGNAVGLITYMRTDGLHISDEAAKGIHGLVIGRYGQKFAPESSRKYFKKVKNAQEAHEAIRPTDIRRLPSQLSSLLDEDSLRLYTLIWARTMACQMEPTIISMIQVDIGNPDESIVLRSSCSGVEFPGFQAVYKDSEAKAIRYNENEGNDRSEAFKALSELKKGDALFLGEVELKQHHTQPPARYSEGALVKKLEELGIGRPSTYASIMKVLQDRKYVTIKSRVLYPEFRGRMVSAFLSHHFSEVTDYSFTADMETELDNISGGLTEWKSLLGDYWTRFKKYCELTSTVHIHEVEKLLEKTFGDFLFSSLPDKNRTCPSCLEGELIFKVTRFGAGYFIGCSQHPKCKYIAKTLYGDDEDESAPRNNGAVEEPKLLGLYPVSNEKVLVKNGPYGYYVQLGEDRNGYLPKRASLSHIKDVSSFTLEDALEMLRYPLTLGTHPQDGLPIIVKIAKNGFAIKHRSSIAPVPKDLKPNEIKLEKALELLSGPNVKKSGRPKRGKVAAEEIVEALF